MLPVLTGPGGEIEEPSHEALAFIKKGLASILIRVELRFAIRAGFKVQLSRFQKLSKDNGRGSPFKLV